MTIATINVFTVITKITAARSISTWFHRKWTLISIPMLARKSSKKVADTFDLQKEQT